MEFLGKQRGQAYSQATRWQLHEEREVVLIHQRRIIREAFRQGKVPEQVQLSNGSEFIASDLERSPGNVYQARRGPAGISAGTLLYYHRVIQMCL